MAEQRKHVPRVTVEAVVEEAVEQYIGDAFDLVPVVEASVIAPPSMMTAKIGDMVHMNGLLYDIPGGSYTWRAMSPTYHWVAMLNPHLAGASFIAEELGTYHVYLDVIGGQVDIPVTVTK